MLLVLTNWLERREREVLACVIAESRLLRRQRGTQRVRLTDVGSPSASVGAP